MWKLDWITEDNFRKHVIETIKQYGETLRSYDLKYYNRNIIDPIKMIFDKSVYLSSWSEIVKNEIFRQRDKSNNNSIGYFHQKIFRYVEDCEVPEEGWDVIFTPPGGIELPNGDKVKTIYVEMKNKHNTMNDASAGKTYIKMQDQLLQDDDCCCFLVEAIAKQSQNINWSTTVDKRKVSHKRIRRVSIDQFYYLVTGEETAFYDMCMILPNVIDEVVSNRETPIPNDTVYSELEKNSEKYGSMAMAFYMLGFDSYSGFKDKDQSRLL